MVLFNFFCLNFEVYPKVKVRATEEDDAYEFSVIPLQDFNSLSIRDISPEKERKYLSVAKVPMSYIPRSITPSPALPKAVKKSEQEAKDNAKPHIRASSIPRPRAVMSSPDNDQLLGNRNKMRLERPSAMRNQNMTQCRQSAPSKPLECRSLPITAARKTLKTTAESKLKVTPQTDLAKGKKGSTGDVRVPRANILKAKPCFTVT